MSGRVDLGARGRGISRDGIKQRNLRKIYVIHYRVTRLCYTQTACKDDLK